MKLTKIFGIVLSLHVGVILLVMFQPGCQTVPKKNATTEPTSNVENVETVKPSSGFNAGLNPEPEMAAEKSKSVEFSSPTRPDSGGLIVPGQGVIEAKPLPPILGDSRPIEPAVNLRPSGLSIYKVQLLMRKNSFPLKNQKLNLKQFQVCLILRKVFKA